MKSPKYMLTDEENSPSKSPRDNLQSTEGNTLFKESFISNLDLQNAFSNATNVKQIQHHISISLTYVRTLNQ